jgi:glycerate 2-kinase
VALDPRGFLLRLLRETIDAASPARCIRSHLPPRPKGRTVVVGAGKAAGAMAQAVEQNWRGDLSGLVVTRYGHGVPCSCIEIIEAGHPTPDRGGLDAAKHIIALVQNLTPDDLVLGLISGGGSSLLTLPAEGITLEDKQKVTRMLLASGAPISEINCIRKHLSAIKGGRLALAAQPAKVVSLIISDVPGDDPALVASGPTAVDATSSAQALDILQKYRMSAPPSVRAWLSDPRSETPKPGDTRFARVENRVIMSSRVALAETARVVAAAGFSVHNLGDIEGEARIVASAQAQLALQQRDSGNACVILSGGETTVTVRGKGRGGRNTEYLLALAIALNGAERIHAIACDSDGIDGTEDNAGAIIGPDTLRRAASLGVDAQSALARNDSYGFFAATGDLVITGPTRTNVNDFRAILVT